MLLFPFLGDQKDLRDEVDWGKQFSPLLSLLSGVPVRPVMPWHGFISDFDGREIISIVCG